MSEERLICALTNGLEDSDFMSPMVLNDGKNVAMLHRGGVNVWQLESPEIETKISNKSGFSKMFLLEDQEHLMIEFEGGDFYLMEVDTFRIVKRFKLPRGTRMYRQLGDGDLLVVLRNRHYKEDWAQRQKRKLRQSMRHLGGLSKIRGLTNPLRSSKDHLKSEFGNILRRNLVIGKQDTVVPQRSQNRVLGDSDLPEDLPDDENKKSNVFQVDPDEILMDIEDDDDVEMGMYKINNASNQVDKLTAGNTLTPDSNFVESETQNDAVKNRRRNREYLNIQVGGTVEQEEIRPELFKYRLVRLVLDDYMRKGSKNKGLYTIFQTDHEIVNMDSKLATQVDMGEKSTKNRINKMASRVKSNRSKGVVQNHVVLVALKSNQVYKVRYETDYLSRVKTNSVYLNRLFQNLSNFKSEAAHTVTKSGNSSKANNQNFKKGPYSDEKQILSPNSKPRDSETNPRDISEDTAAKDLTMKEGEIHFSRTKFESNEMNNLSRKSETFFKSEFRRRSKFIRKKTLKTLRNEINGIKYIEDDDLALASILSESKKDGRRILILMTQRGDNPYCEIRVHIDDSVMEDIKDLFRMDIIKQPKKTAIRRRYQLYMYSTRVIATFDYTMWSNTLSFKKLFKKEAASQVAVRCSPERRLFMVPINASIRIWDSSLTHLLFIFETEREVDETILLEDAGLLLAYDKLYYYELDLNEFRLRRKIRVSEPGPTGGFRLLVDFTLLPASTEFSATFHSKNEHTLASIPFSEELNLRVFPFHDLSQSFLKKGYRRYVLAFAKFYFNRLEQQERKDFVYGPLNPLFFAIYHNDSNLLEDLLDTFFYPKRINGYVSPLEYSFAVNYRTTIKVLCDNLIRRSDYVHFSRSDFKNLLRSDILTCHRLLATIPTEPEVNILPRLIYMKSNVKTIFHDYQSSLMVHLKEQDLKYFKEDEVVRPKYKGKPESRAKVKDKSVERTEGASRTSSHGSLLQIINSNVELTSQRILDEKEQEIDETTRRYVMGTEQSKIFKSEVTLRTVPFKYNFNIGTEDSAAFVFNYSKSNSQDFVLSDWAEIIKWKWNRLKIPLISLMVIFYAYFLGFAFSTAIYPKHEGLRLFAVAFNVILILIEILQMLTFIFFDPRSYFLDMENLWDWIIYICTLIYLTALKSQWSTRGAQIFLLCILIPLFFRGFLYLRILSTFTALVGMIQIIMTRLISFFLLLIYTYIGVAFMLFKVGKRCTDPVKCLSDDQVFQMVYYWIFLGSVESDDFETPYTAFPIIFGSLFTSIILLNILIAFLSNEFSRLEEHQRVQELRERAALIMNFEVLVMFFKYRLTRKIQLRRSFEREKYLRMLRPLMDSSQILNTTQKRAAKRLKDYMRQEKFLYIFRKVDLEKDFAEENLYFRVKHLEKMNQELSGLVIKRSRSQEEQIERVLELVQGNSKTQDKTVDDLKRLIGKNTTQLKDNTETLIIDIASQKKKIEYFMRTLKDLEQHLSTNSGAVQDLLNKS